MPYQSVAQRGYMHAAAERGDIAPGVVAHFDEESRGQHDIPYKVKKKRKKTKCLVPVTKAASVYEEGLHSRPLPVDESHFRQGGPEGGTPPNPPPIETGLPPRRRKLRTQGGGGELLLPINPTVYIEESPCEYETMLGELPQVEKAVGKFNEDLHPRAAAGDTEHHGGEFVQKEAKAAVGAGTVEGEIERPWTIHPHRYLDLLGVPVPSSAHVSPAQLGMMSRGQKAAYQARLSAELAAADAAKAEWRRHVIEAWDAGKIEPHSPELHQEAKNTLANEQIDRNKAAEKADTNSALLANEFTSMDEVNVGDRVFSLMGSTYGTITKKNAKTLMFEAEKRGNSYTPPPMKVGLGAIFRVDPREIRKSVGVWVPITKSFSEADHPRVPKGDTHGGQFAPKETDQVEDVPSTTSADLNSGVYQPESELSTSNAVTLGVTPAANGGPPQASRQPPTGGAIMESRDRKGAERISAALRAAYGYPGNIVHQYGGYIIKDTGLDEETAHDFMYLLGSSIASKKVTAEKVMATREVRLAEIERRKKEWDEMQLLKEKYRGRFANKSLMVPITNARALRKSPASFAPAPFVASLESEGQRERQNGHKSPPKGYPKEKRHYADPKNFKYPIDTEDHVRAANSYLSKEHNQAGYSPAEVKKMFRRIHAAGKKHGIKFAGSEADKGLFNEVDFG